jgi:hypothetical protein
MKQKDSISSMDANKSPEVPPRELNLTDICQQYELLDNAADRQSLPIAKMLTNLATDFRSRLPRIVSLALKDAGKTFIYVQLSRLKYWDEFIRIVLNEETEDKAYIFPFIHVKTLPESDLEIVTGARAEIEQAFSEGIPNLVVSDRRDRIRQFIDRGISETKWREFWIDEIANSLGMKIAEDESISLREIDSYLKIQQIRIIYLFDGLEEIFGEIASDERQQLALRALIDIPYRLSENSHSNLGSIVFLRRDTIRHALSQNIGQFESLYDSYSL